MSVHELSAADARRIAIRAQLLDAQKPAGLLEVVRHLTLLQIDPTAAIAPNADLVAWTRLGSAYSRAELREARDKQTLIELDAMIRPAEDFALYRADMAARRPWPERYSHPPLPPIDRPTVGLSELVPIVGLFGHRTAVPTNEGEDHD